MMNERKFSDLIRRYQSGTCTEEEKQLVEKWLENRYESRQSEKLSQQERKEILTDISTKLFDEIKSKRPRQVTLSSWWQIAAAIALVGTSSYIVWQTVNNRSAYVEEMLVASAFGNEVSKVMLTDGSIIWLKGNSKLTYPRKFSGHERNVVLTGEALFEVAKDPQHPFIISCGNLKATVLGTSFNIKATEADIEVLVLTGKVALTSNKGSERVIVMPNEKILFSNANQQLVKFEAKVAEQTQIVSSTEYDMHFHDTRMDEVVDRIEEKFNVSVIIDDSTLNNCLITIDLTDQSLDRTLEMASAILGFTYDIDNGAIAIHGSGCEILDQEQ